MFINWSTYRRSTFLRNPSRYTNVCYKICYEIYCLKMPYFVYLFICLMAKSKIVYSYIYKNPTNDLFVVCLVEKVNSNATCLVLSKNSQGIHKCSFILHKKLALQSRSRELRYMSIPTINEQFVRIVDKCDMKIWWHVKDFFFKS